MKLYKAKRAVYRVEENEGKITLYKEYNCLKNESRWHTSGGFKMDNGNKIIKKEGSAEEFLAKCIEVDDIKAFVHSLNEEKEQQIAQAEWQREHLDQMAHDEYTRIFANEVTPTTIENIRVLLRYLNTTNWGTWELPQMSIHYACHQYDCDGHTATTIKLDEPIEYLGEQVSQFVYGAPRGYLEKYERI